MFWFALVCGWVFTAAVIALAWINVREEGRLSVGVAIGAIGGALWPVTLWVAIGAWLLARTATKRRTLTTSTAGQTEAQLAEAEAFAKQADIEEMPSSAAYWRAEVQRLSAQGPATVQPHPAPTGVIVLGCAVAAVATLGGLFVTAPSSTSTAPSTSPPTASGTNNSAVQSTTTDRALTTLGNLRKEFGERSGYAVVDDRAAADFVISEPRPAKCNPYAQNSRNGTFVELSIAVTTYDDPDQYLKALSFGSHWEFVGTDGRSVEASTSAAATCAYDSPPSLGPNRIYEFRIVVDLPERDGVLIFAPPAATAGWEWQYTR